MTLMWCGFEKRPMIMRAYGAARTTAPARRRVRRAERRTSPATFAGARQIYDMHGRDDATDQLAAIAVPFFRAPRAARSVEANGPKTKGA